MNETWRADAACAQIGYWWHFPDGWGENRLRQEKQALKICASFPVIMQCREYAINTKQQFGVWGGLSENELSDMVSRSKRRRTR